MKKTSNDFNVKEIESKIGYVFKDKALLAQAFTRTSFCNEHNARSKVRYQSNEVLEFFGDGVLSVAIISFMLSECTERYEHGIKTELTEGDFSNLKSKLSDKQNLSRSMKALGLQKYLRMGEGDSKLGIQDEPSVMEDLFESIVGAIYIDSDMSISAVIKAVSGMLDMSVYTDRQKPIQSAKNAIQEWCADKKRRLPPPRYETLSEDGPDHKKTYMRGCYIGERLMGRGVGKNFKIADAAAAEDALKALMAEETQKTQTTVDISADKSTKSPASAKTKKAEKAEKAEPKADEPAEKQTAAQKASPKATKSAPKQERPPKAKPEQKKAAKTAEPTKQAAPVTKTEQKKTTKAAQPSSEQKVKATKSASEPTTAKTKADKAPAPGANKPTAKTVAPVANPAKKKTAKPPEITNQSTSAAKPATVKTKKSSAKTPESRLKEYALASHLPSPAFKDLGVIKSNGRMEYRVECRLGTERYIAAAPSRPEAREAAALMMVRILDLDKKPEKKDKKKQAPQKTEAKPITGKAKRK